MAGEIYFDGNRYTEAAHCYTLAATASREATGFDLWACAMTRHTFIAVYERKFVQAAPMLDVAATLARRGDSALSTRHWVSVVQAETFAGLGDFDTCQRALDAAERVRELPRPVHNGGWLRFDGSRLAEERGTCYVTLGRPELAEDALTDALRQGLSPRRHASALTYLAMIVIQRCDRRLRPGTRVHPGRRRQHGQTHPRTEGSFRRSLLDRAGLQALPRPQTVLCPRLG